MAKKPSTDAIITKYFLPPYISPPNIRNPIPPVSLAVIKITTVRNSSGRVTNGACRNVSFRLIVYCSTEMPKLTAASPIQTCGLPGKKKSMAVMFQLAISQTWCQRNNSGTVNKIKTPPTTPRVPIFISGF